MPRRVLQGTVVSDKADKTIVVRVDRRVQEPLYKKYITRSKKYAAHDEQNRCKVGDIVRIRAPRLPGRPAKLVDVPHVDAGGDVRVAQRY